MFKLYLSQLALAKYRTPIMPTERSCDQPPPLPWHQASQKQIFDHKTQLPQTTEDNRSYYTKEIIPIRVLCYENSVLKKSRPIFVLILHLFYSLPSVLLSLLIFVTECLDDNFLTRLMIVQGNFFINVLNINRSRLLALIDWICGTEICV